MPSHLDFTDQWVLITGASAGIGEALARAFAAHHANLVLVARGEERLKNLAARLATRVEVIPADLQTRDGVDALIAEVDRREITVSHLVNNAGFGGAGPLHRQDPEHLTQMIELNCIALLRLTRHYLPGMVERNSGGMIQLASVASFVPTPFMAAYGASKAFVLSLSTALAEELRDTHVRMLAVCPGPVATEFQERAGYSLTKTEAPAQITSAEVAQATLKAYAQRKRVVVPGTRNALNAFLSRFGSPELKAWAAGVTLKRSGRHKVGMEP